MRYEVVEEAGVWSVQSEGEVLARFEDQDQALNDVAERLRKGDATATASLSVRYQGRAA